MKLFYRISDNSYPKPKLIGATKEVCLNNFVKSFNKVVFGQNQPPAKDFIPPMKIIADKCERKTVAMLSQTGIPIILTDYGNAGSLKHAINLAIQECQDDELVYFVEDDYLHLEESQMLLEDGIQRADYVTLYDHPDKYTSQYNFGEVSKVIRTERSHWRYTISTCMTFATKIKTLKEDIEVWEKFTNESHPPDHQIFSELGKEKNRNLAVCIPGAACHCDLEYSHRTKRMLIEPWAIELMCQELILEIGNKNYSMLNDQARWIEQKHGLEKLMALDALRQSLK